MDQGSNTGRARRPRVGRGRATLAEVAARVGVSTATVSRAFNQPNLVSSAIVARIREAASEIGWIPDAAARALASSRTDIAGAIIPTLDNEIFARQVSGMQSVLAQRGVTLLLGCSNYDPEDSLNQVRVMLLRGIEALAIVGEDHPPELFALLASSGVPYVVTYSFDPASLHPCIGFDNAAAFARMTEHLLALGHRRFAGIFQPTATNARVRARIAGFRAALRTVDLDVQDRDIEIGPGTLEQGASSCTVLLSRPPEERPTAIVCGNDTLALGALSVCTKLGLSAPQDVSVTGFDDLAVGSLWTPALTTMSVDNYRIGVLAAEQLIRRLDDKSAVGGSVELHPVLRSRASAGRRD